MGRFTSTGIDHRWQWRDRPWPEEGFRLAPDDLEPPVGERWSEVYPVPPAGARRPFTIRQAARRLYAVMRGDVLLAFLAISGTYLHWIEVKPGTLERMGHETVEFKPEPFAAAMDPITWSRVQRARALPSR